jgi:hypothetical protein
MAIMKDRITTTTAIPTPTPVHEFISSTERTRRLRCRLSEHWFDLKVVPLGQLDLRHRAISVRDERQGLTLGCCADLRHWDDDALPDLLGLFPPLVSKTSKHKQDVFQLIAGDQFLPQLATLLTPDCKVPVLVLRKRLKPNSLLRVAAAYQLGLAAASGFVSPRVLQILANDAAKQGVGVLRQGPASFNLAIGI